MKIRSFYQKLLEKIRRLPIYYVELKRKIDVQIKKFNAKIWLDRIKANLPDHFDEGLFTFCFRFSQVLINRYQTDNFQTYKDK